ncbi:putative membrane protein, partial [Smittium culicis]
NKYFYSPRSFSKNKDSRPNPLPRSFFGWFKPLFKFSKNDFIKYCGTDGYMILYIIKQNLILFCIFSFFAIVILIPINVTSNGNQPGLDSLTISNTINDPNRLWAHLFCTILFSFSGIPADKNTSEQITAELGDRIPPGTQIFPVNDESILFEPYTERNKLHLALESELARIARLEKKSQIAKEKNPKAKNVVIKRKQMKLGFLGLFGKKVDIIEHATSKIVSHNTLIDEKKPEYDSQPKTLSAFLVFKTVQQAHIFANRNSGLKNIVTKPSFLTVSIEDVDQNDIVWHNLAVPQFTQHIRKLISYAISLAVILLWIIPTGFVSLVANFDTLASFSAFKWVNDLPTSVKGILKGLIPAIALVILTIIVPIIFRMLIRFEKGPLTRSPELKLIDRFFAFKIINIFIIYLISGSIISSLSTIVNDPGAVITDLTSNIPKNSTFYVTYVLLLGLSSSSGDISMIAGAVIRMIFRKFFGQTPRSLLQSQKPQQLSVGVTIPVISFVFLLGIVFSTIAPIMTVISLIFFSLYLVVYRYNLIYVYDPLSFNYGGHLSIKLISHRWGSLYVLQVTILFLLALNVKNSSSKVGYSIRLALMIITISSTAISHIYMRFFIYPRMLFIDSSLSKKLTGSKVNKWASSARKVFKRKSANSANEYEKSTSPNSDIMLITDNSRNQNDWRLNDSHSLTESEIPTTSSLVNCPNNGSNLCNLGYEKLTHPLSPDTFVPPEFRDNGFTVVWAPNIESVAVDAVYDETQELLKDKGSVVTDGNHYDEKAFLHLTVDSVPGE